MFPDGLAKRVPAGSVLNFSMHYTTERTAGRDRNTAIYPDGHREVLLRVPNYHFDWQLEYYLSEPKVLPKGTRLLVTAHFDNSTANKNNPDPGATVHYGDQTWDEMMAGYFVYTIESRPMRATGLQQ